MPLFPAWLLLLLALALADEPQETEGGRASQHDQCFPTLSREAGALNLGQRWGDSSPTASLHVDLRTVTSAASSFDFRTFDPEGVIFFGNTSVDTDWFVLGLRRGKPEMQIHNTVTNISVTGGLCLNDGRWHRVLVKNEGESVTLEVDGDDVLTLHRVSHAIVGRPSSDMHIGVGGLLIPRRELLTPMHTAMDGCMRRWNWLNRSLEWQEGISLADAGPKACFATLRRGSFFPGTGLASFLLSDLPTGRGAAGGNWSLEVEMGVRAAQQVSALLAVSTAERTPVFSLRLQHKDLVVQVGNATVLGVPLPAEGCLDVRLFLHLTPAGLTLRLGDGEASGPVQPPDFERLRDLWLGKRGTLSIGGLPGSLGQNPTVAFAVFVPGEEEPAEAQEGGSFRGCLREIRVQGSTLDLDAAHRRSDSIWAHSCPGGESPAGGP
ncbi:hypothetical protein lerEdw1_006380 [Lerista edwardsae]|nr:hypothetical protein lerEdw1_006380 [Lerista edwardsae]